MTGPHEPPDPDASHTSGTPDSASDAQPCDGDVTGGERRFEVVHGLEPDSFAEALVAQQDAARGTPPGHTASGDQRLGEPGVGTSPLNVPRPRSHLGASAQSGPIIDSVPRPRRGRKHARDTWPAFMRVLPRRKNPDAPAGPAGPAGPGGVHLTELVRMAAFDLRATARTRSTWWVVLAWVVHVYGLLALALAASGAGSGTLVHSLMASFTLLGGIVVAPVLGTDTIARLRSNGLLDMLRLTGLSSRALSWGLAVGAIAKIAVLVLIAVPALLVGPVMGGTDLTGAAWTLLVIGVVCAAAVSIAVACAAFIARRAFAITAAFVVLGAFLLGPPMLYGALLPLTEQTVPTQVRVLDIARTAGDTDPCTVVTEDRSRTRSELVWWALLPQPFVVLADAAPGRVGNELAFEPLSALRSHVRQARLRPPDVPVLDECPVPTTASGGSTDTTTDADAEALLAHWPFGLALIGLTGAAATALTTRRLRAPGEPAWGERGAAGVPQDA